MEKLQQICLTKNPVEHVEHTLDLFQHVLFVRNMSLGFVPNVKKSKTLLIPIILITLSKRIILYTVIWIQVESP
jgi:hypothetical protein